MVRQPLKQNKQPEFMSKTKKLHAFSDNCKLDLSIHMLYRCATKFKAEATRLYFETMRKHNLI